MGNLISTIGTWFLLVGFGLMTFYFLRSLWRGEKASANPWGGQTLEWSIASPPIEHNFHEIPTVHSLPYEYGVKTYGGAQ